MKKKNDVLGFVLLALGVVATFVGIRLASGDDVRGWAALAGGVGLMVLAFRAMRARKSTA